MTKIGSILFLSLSRDPLEVCKVCIFTLLNHLWQLYHLALNYNFLHTP